MMVKMVIFGQVKDEVLLMNLDRSRMMVFLLTLGWLQLEVS